MFFIALMLLSHDMCSASNWMMSSPADHPSTVLIWFRAFFYFHIYQLAPIMIGPLGGKSSSSFRQQIQNTPIKPSSKLKRKTSRESWFSPSHNKIKLIFSQFCRWSPFNLSSTILRVRWSNFQQYHDYFISTGTAEQPTVNINIHTIFNQTMNLIIMMLNTCGK